MTRLRQERLARGVSQAALARDTGISAPNLSRLEHGVMVPYPRWQARIAAALAWRGDPAELFKPVDDGAALRDAV